MKTITITREHMIKAALEEPLLPGSWVNLDHSHFFVHNLYLNKLGLKKEDFTADERTCPVCAVGGTFRQALGSQFIDFSVGMYMSEENNDSYLSMLSNFFERREWNTRQDIVDWIEENIPEDFKEEVEI